MTRASFDREIDGIIVVAGEMGGIAEHMVLQSSRVLIERNLDAADEIVAMDIHADQAAKAIDTAIFRALALQQPCASDLRQMLALLQATACIERIADHAKSIARGVLKSRPYNCGLSLGGWDELGRLALVAVTNAIGSLCRRDAALAMDVWESDVPIDRLQKSLCGQMIDRAETQPALVRQAVQFTLAAKHYERIGDQATNIAEHVIFVVSGTPLAAERPRG